MTDFVTHLLSAFAKFVAAGLDPSIAKFGIRGTWVGPGELDHSDSYLERARAASTAWDVAYPLFPNPYLDVIAFLDGGADISRWENNILDIYLPDGSKVGIPLATFTQAAANNSFKPKPLRGSA